MAIFDDSSPAAGALLTRVRAGVVRVGEDFGMVIEVGTNRIIRDAWGNAVRKLTVNVHYDLRTVLGVVELALIRSQVSKPPAWVFAVEIPRREDRAKRASDTIVIYPS